jgi:predicted Zn-dependent protease with MMP-like domain
VDLTAGSTRISPAAGSTGTRRTSLGSMQGSDQRCPVDFERVVLETLESLPRELRDRISNVEVVVEDEPPHGQPLLGLYQGIPITRRDSGYAGVLPDKITIYRGPLERLYGDDVDVLRDRIRHVVLHEIAHHFGISDARLVELDRY